MLKRQKQYITLREKILRDYGVGKVVTPQMLWKRYGRKHSKDYIGSVLATGEKSRKNSPCRYVFTWRVFRPGRPWAVTAWAAASLALLVAMLLQILRGDAVPHWALRPENHVYMWVRVAAFLWAGLESLRYAGMMRRQAGVALGTAIGSNVFNILAIMGVAAVLSPAPIQVPIGFLTLDLPVMLVASMLLVLAVWRGRPLGRLAGVRPAVPPADVPVRPGPGRGP